MTDQPAVTYEEGCPAENVDTALRGIAAATVILQSALDANSPPTEHVVANFLDLVRHAASHARAELASALSHHGAGRADHG